MLYLQAARACKTSCLLEMGRFGLILLCGAALVLGACNSPQASQAIPTRTAGSLTATLTVVPYPPAPMRDAWVALALQDADGRAVTGAVVHFKMTMPGCPMAPSYLETTEEESGVYKVQTLFTMAGAWQIDADVSLPSQSVQFTFYLATK